MRFAYLVLIVPFSLASGCSMLIARSGKDLHTLTTREQVHASLGEPSTTGIENGKSFEEYHTRQKISESETVRVYGLGMGIVMSYGAYELIAFPKELYLLGSRTLRGQTLRVRYDENGKVSGFALDGEPLDDTLLGGLPRNNSPDAYTPE
jgi:hypothetical protein